MGKLERLAELRNKGVITDPEFEQMKRRLMGATPV
ncbi:SHOCT domain-containing protein [Mesorhizobium sp. B2-4-13]|nr:SHOCT domain-containing protein [Mesorhizobium sp. B2-4-13]